MPFYRLYLPIFRRLHKNLQLISTLSTSSSVLVFLIPAPSTSQFTSMPNRKKEVVNRTQKRKTRALHPITRSSSRSLYLYRKSKRARETGSASWKQSGDCSLSFSHLLSLSSRKSLALSDRSATRALARQGQGGGGGEG